MPPVALALLLVIRTYDMFGVSAGDLDTARRTADGALRAAGLDTSWTACRANGPHADQPSARCGLVPESGELLIRIVADGGRTVEPDALGDAFIDTRSRQGVLATLYGGRIAALAEQAGIEPGPLLGRALAHEVGHLLLGTSAHRGRGLMRAQWTLEELRRPIDVDWRFSGSDALAMQAGLTRRLNTPPHERMGTRQPSSEAPEGPNRDRELPGRTGFHGRSSARLALRRPAEPMC
jgi:hypothetical protein